MANPKLNAGALMKPGQRKIAKTSRYEILKDKIRTWWQDRFKVGEALMEIRDSKLYKDEHPTFEDFCESEYGFKRAHAYRLIGFAEVKQDVKMSPIGDKITESQARALGPVPPEKRAELLDSVAENGKGTVTAKSISAAVKKADKPKHLDKIGYPIPDEIYDDWREAEAFNDTIKTLHRIKLRVEDALENRELIFREVTNSTVADLTNAYQALNSVLPYSVCPTCQGHNRKTCLLCKQRGWLSKFAYEHYVPKKTRQIREAHVST